MINALCYKLRLWKLGLTPEKMGFWVADKMPRWLVGWCLIRAWLNATTGEYSNQDVTTVTMEQVIRRWEKK
jgi:hypothetical protein